MTAAAGVASKVGKKEKCLLVNSIENKDNTLLAAHCCFYSKPNARLNVPSVSRQFSLCQLLVSFRATGPELKFRAREVRPLNRGHTISGSGSTALI